MPWARILATNQIELIAQGDRSLKFRALYCHSRVTNPCSGVDCTSVMSLQTVFPFPYDTVGGKGLIILLCLHFSSSYVFEI